MIQIIERKENQLQKKALQGFNLQGFFQQGIFLFFGYERVVLLHSCAEEGVGVGSAGRLE